MTSSKKEHNVRQEFNVDDDAFAWHRARGHRKNIFPPEITKNQMYSYPTLDRHYNDVAWYERKSIKKKTIRRYNTNDIVIISPAKVYYNIVIMIVLEKNITTVEQVVETCKIRSFAYTTERAML